MLIKKIKIIKKIINKGKNKGNKYALQMIEIDTE